MAAANMTSSTDFFMVGFSDFSELQVPLFILFLISYLITLLGNLLIMAVIYHDSSLHTPMYFFLTNLSFADIGYTSVTFPNMLVNFFSGCTHITLSRCLTQLYFFMIMIVTESSLLTVMAYDRYVAICKPLHYTMIMSKTLCGQLAAGAWMFSLVEPIPHLVLISKFSFCKSHEINHFFCDLTVVLKLSCTSTFTIETMTLILSALVGLMSFLLILTSYVNIIEAILKIQSRKGRDKAFNTCASHLAVVILLYSALFGMYLRPSSTHSMKQNKIFSLLYIAVVPMCNPIIYSLKNKELKNALRKAMRNDDGTIKISEFQ
ncbi:olfactory receptor 1G1-like [Ambystoma mexicanum]|uniref:olfactory receptor 1G1-like n=1 Tax=Ambystoma mexicanum TaxID=8296 RepID=UPI0037E781D6